VAGKNNSESGERQHGHLLYLPKNVIYPWGEEKFQEIFIFVPLNCIVSIYFVHVASRSTNLSTN
jgi:hypothetical protein